MIIKKFVGKTEEEAVEAAKKELGSGVVIMNVKAVERRGLAALFRSKQTEVTVALEEENDTFKTVRREASPSAARKEQPRPVKRLSAAPPAEEDFSYDNALGTEDRAAIEKKLDNLESLLVSRFQQSESAREDTSAAEKTAAGGEEQEEEQQEEITQQQRFLRLLYNTMLDNEVDEKYANQIIDEMEKSAKPNMPFDYALTNVYQKMVLKFGKPEGISLAENGTKVIFFIGPTGVGKTTTIAKLASYYIVDEKKKVALITADTYRIAAAEQLRTYAGILEVPFRVVYSPEEIQQALAIFSGYDYIFVDTSGHSYQNEEQKQSMSRIIHSVDDEAEKEVYLVLSATTKYRDLLRIVDAYLEMTDFKLIFTKLDETSALGNLLNLKLYTGKALSYITCGQNVPDDFRVFSPQDAVRQLLGGKN